MLGEEKMGVKSRDISNGDNYLIEQCDVLIFTAIKALEELALDKHLRRVGALSIDQTEAERLKGIHRWQLERSAQQGEPLKILTRCLNRAGNGFAGIELSHFLNTQFRPKLIVFCGIGGSLDVEKAQLGNVVVSDSMHWRGFDKISGDSISKEMRKKSLEDHTINSHLKNLVNPSYG